MSDNEEYPEYFIIRADNFTTKDIAPNWMEQWMNYRNTGTISPEDDAPGLPQAREALIFDKMPPAEKKEYRDHIDAIRVQQDAIDDSRAEGREEGREEGRKEGREEGRAETTIKIARNMLQLGSTQLSSAAPPE